MKVEIITRHSVPNYGSLLQSYATQRAIEKLGHEAEFINYIEYAERYQNLASTLIKGKRWDNNPITRMVYKLIQTPNYAKMYQTFEKYRKGFLKETDTLYGSIEELSSNIPEGDVYCSGSDQIWGKIGINNYDPAYFLEFIQDPKVKCISYAASLGKEKLNKQLDENLEKLLKKYDTILVREKSAVQIIKEKGFDNVKQVLDPTFLLTKQEWEKLITKKPKEEKYVLVYQLHSNKEFDCYAKEFAKKHHMKLLRLSPSFYHITRSGKLIYLPDQFAFLSYFANAEYVLTDSFHATAFSIILNKKFIDILPGATSTRITSILELVGLEDRILKSYQDFTSIEKEINYEQINRILDRERKQSIALLQEALGEEEKNINTIGKHSNCCGCRACEQLCPTKAISMLPNNEGFIEPYIDKEKCIHCGLCLKRCPQANRPKTSEFDKSEVYAAKNKEIQEQKEGSSGGIFSILANHVLSQGGIVFGAGFTSELAVEHTGIETKERLAELKGSKYVQSNTKHTFSEVKHALEKGKKVLYTATPCQIGGLKRFLGKEYDNLITIDLVCHGVPSPKLFEKYVHWLEEKEHSKIKSLSFRSKEKKTWGLNMKIEYTSKTKYTPAALDPYYQTFLDGKTYRECCYDCLYANTDRIGDLTIADYWGIEKQHPEFYDENGVSAIMINTKKGRDIFEQIKENMVTIPTQIEKVIKENHNLVKPTQRYRRRDSVYQGIEEKSFADMIKENLNYHTSIKAQIKNKIPNTVKKTIKRIIKKR